MLPFLVALRVPGQGCVPGQGDSKPSRQEGIQGRAGLVLLAPAQAALHFSCSGAPEILESPKRKASGFASGLQQEMNSREVMRHVGLTGDWNPVWVNSGASPLLPNT